MFLHHSGHTHRNKRTISTTAAGVVFQEVAAVKEYPGGFHLLRVFSGGYALNFYKFHDPDAQAWSERSRPEYLGLAPFYTFGNASDRNAVFKREASRSFHSRRYPLWAWFIIVCACSHALQAFSSSPRRR